MGQTFEKLCYPSVMHRPFSTFMKCDGSRSVTVDGAQLENSMHDSSDFYPQNLNPLHKEYFCHAKCIPHQQISQAEMSN